MSLWDGYNQLMGLYEDMHMLDGREQRDNRHKNGERKGTSLILIQLNTIG